MQYSLPKGLHSAAARLCALSGPPFACCLSPRYPHPPLYCVSVMCSSCSFESMQDEGGAGDSCIGTVLSDSWPARSRQGTRTDRQAAAEEAPAQP